MISSKVNCGTKAANTQHEICFNAEHEPYRSRRLRCKQLCEQFNLASPLNSVERKNILFSLVGAHFPVFIESFFQCEYGENIRIGAETFINHNVTIYDSATVTIGKNVLIGPNCTINTVISNEGNAISCSPITIGNNVWIGANVVICGGVEIGDNTIIGAGCIVRQSVRSHEIMKSNSL